MVFFTGAQTGGALLWGLFANRAGLQPAVLGSAVVVLGAAVVGLFWRVPEAGHLDPQPITYWTVPQLAYDPEPDTGPVLIAVHFTVAAERQHDFLTAMDQLRRSRRRTGATRWELYRDGEHPERFVEIFRVPTWDEHLRQHEGRLTATHRTIEEAALAFSDPPAWAAAFRRLVEDRELLPKLKRGIGTVRTMRDVAGEMQLVYRRAVGELVQ
jgi:quinol monooxygenase YgiN